MTQSELLDKINKQYEYISGVNGDELTDLQKYCALTGITDTSAISEDGENFNDLDEDTVDHLNWLMPGGAGRDIAEDSINESSDKLNEEQVKEEQETKNETNEKSSESDSSDDLSEVEPVIG